MNRRGLRRRNITGHDHRVLENIDDQDQDLNVERIKRRNRNHIIIRDQSRDRKWWIGRKKEERMTSNKKNS